MTWGISTVTVGWVGVSLGGVELCAWCLSRPVAAVSWLDCVCVCASLSNSATPYSIWSLSCVMPSGNESLLVVGRTPDRWPRPSTLRLVSRRVETLCLPSLIRLPCPVARRASRCTLIRRCAVGARGERLDREGEGEGNLCEERMTRRGGEAAR